MVTLAEHQRSGVQMGEGSRRFTVTAITPSKRVLHNGKTEASPQETFEKNLKTKQTKHLKGL